MLTFLFTRAPKQTSNLVMAQESHHDVVTQSQSADVPTFVDASAAQTTDSAARAAVEQSPVSPLQSSANQAGTPSDQHQDANPSSQDANQAERQDPIVSFTVSTMCLSDLRR